MVQADEWSALANDPRRIEIELSVFVRGFRQLIQKHMFYYLSPLSCCVTVDDDGTAAHSLPQIGFYERLEILIGIFFTLLSGS